MCCRGWPSHSHIHPRSVVLRATWGSLAALSNCKGKREGRDGEAGRAAAPDPAPGLLRAVWCTEPPRPCAPLFISPLPALLDPSVTSVPGVAEQPGLSCVTRCAQPAPACSPTPLPVSALRPGAKLLPPIPALCSSSCRALLPGNREGAAWCTAVGPGQCWTLPPGRSWALSCPPAAAMELPSFCSHPLWSVLALLLGMLLWATRRRAWDPRRCPTDLTGKTVIVTGANSGERGLGGTMGPRGCEGLRVPRRGMRVTCGAAWGRGVARGSLPSHCQLWWHRGLQERWLPVPGLHSATPRSAPCSPSIGDAVPHRATTRSCCFSLCTR